MLYYRQTARDRSRAVLCSLCLELLGIDLDAGAHGGGSHQAADVGALGGGGLGLDDGLHTTGAVSSGA